MNVAVVVGEVSGEVHVQVQDGEATVIISFDVKANAAGSSVSVPVSWIGPVDQVPEVPQGAAITVIGSVRKRFYRRAGATVSRTDVLADRVILGPPGRSRVARRKAAEALMVA